MRPNSLSIVPASCPTPSRLRVIPVESHDHYRGCAVQSAHRQLTVDYDFCRLGMFDDIVEGFLDNAVQGDMDFGRKLGFIFSS